MFVFETEDDEGKRNHCEPVVDEKPMNALLCSHHQGAAQSRHIKKEHCITPQIRLCIETQNVCEEWAQQHFEEMRRKHKSAASHFIITVEFDILRPLNFM